jgi:hypothetical protein
MSIFGCEQQKTITDFYADFDRNCKHEYFIREMKETEAQVICTCMMKEAINRWKSLGELEDSLIKEDRQPRGPTDFLRGASRITYRSCKKSDPKGSE